LINNSTGIDHMASSENRSVYIGGFGNGKKLAEGVGEALSPDNRDVDVFTFSQAMDDPGQILRAIKGAKVFTHSAGINTIKDSSPSEIIAVAPPLPSSQKGLVLRAGVKSARMIGHGLSGKEAFSTVNSYNASSVGELMRHPVGNLKHLKEIANTNSITLAASAEAVGIPTQLFFMDRDDFGFIPNTEQQIFAKTLGIQLNMIEGRHDQLPLYPTQTLTQINIPQI
jgi:hypothetical protein